MRVRDYLNPMHGWKNSTDVDKVRVYTVQSFQLIIAAIAAAAVVASLGNEAYVAAAATVVCAAAGLVVLQRTPTLGGMSPGGIRVALIVLLTSAVVLVAFGEIPTAVWAAIFVTTPVAALVSLRWSLAAGVVAAALALALGSPVREVVIIGMSVIAMATAVRMSMWLLRIVNELDATRDAAAALSVAEERLRFSRDLHDVVGRALSAIAVKSELAATLAKRGDDRAAAQMDEVRVLAHESMADARELVRGYRSIDVRSELVGARSLLSAAGIRTELVGEVSDVPQDSAEQAAWVVREGVTNILRHSDATYCRIEFDVNTIRIVNDGPAAANGRGDGTGLSGLRERLTAVGAELSVEARPDSFTLTARFTDPEGTS